MKYIIMPMLLGSMFVLSSCSEESIFGEEGNSLTITLQMPGEQKKDAPRRVGLNPIENTKDFYATWSPNDKVQVILCGNNEIYDLGRAQVTNLSDDKRTATVNIDMRNTPHVLLPYTLFLFAGNDNPASADRIGGGNFAAYCTYEIQREVGGYFHAPLYCRLQVKSEGEIPTAQFQHFGTYEVLHVNNATDRPITFAHQGFETDRPWYQASNTIWFYDGYDTSPHGEWDGDTESQTMTIMPHSENVVYSWYIPSGFPVSDARLVACINGEYNIQSTNTFSSTVIPQTGNAYHMYATWDGTELKFDNVDDNSFHLSANSISLYVNTDSPVTIFNGSGEYDVINENPDIVDYDINGVHVAHAPSRYYDMGGGHGEPIEGDLWWITAKKIGDATLKLIDKQTTKELILKVTVTQAPSLTLAQSNVEMNVGETKHVEILTGSQWYEVSTDNNGVVSVSKATISTGGGGRRGESGSSYTGIYAIIEALSAGEAVVTVKDLSSGETADINVKVSSSGDYPVAEAIDLGLPSGTLWASWNVGASKPEEYGGYYAWGETEEKDYYDWSTYTHCDGSRETCHHIGDDIAGTEYDVAHVKWGGSWRMPTKEQIWELLNNCTRTWTNQNGVNGTLVTGPNGASIFLPAAEFRRYDIVYDQGTLGDYWSSSLYPFFEYCACFLSFYSDYWTWNNSERYEGLPVRAVCVEYDGLVENGDFSSGTDGFTSDYEYISETGNYALVREGTYTIGTSPRQYHIDFVNHGDHTTGNGNMLIVNGAIDNNKYVWKKTFFVDKGKTYEFSAWFLNVCMSNVLDKNMIEYNINGIPITGTYDVTENGWDRFIGTFTATETGSIEIKIRSQSSEAGGNDFAIDDIFFSHLHSFDE